MSSDPAATPMPADAPNSPEPTVAATESARPPSIAPSLLSLRWRIRLWLVVDRASTLLGSGLAVCLGAALLDYLVRMPQAMRIVLWLIGLGLVIGAIRRFVIPAARFKPSLTDLALRIEQTPEGQRAGLRDLLAAGLEFHETVPNQPVGLRQQISASASGLFSGLRTGSILRPVGGARRGLTLLMLTVAVLGSIVTLAPLLTLVGAKRTLMPWTSAEWPSRTALMDATDERAHALTATLPMRAILTRTNRSPGQTRVQLKYRLIEDGRTGPTETALLTPQGVKHDRDLRGEVYERLLDPRTIVGTLASDTSNPDRRLEYWFETSDSQTEPATIRLVEPPSVTRLRITVTPPVYAADFVAGENGFVSGTKDLGPGRPDASAITPVLAGSKVSIEFGLNKEIPLPASGSGPDVQAFAAKLMGGSTTPAGLSIEAKGQSFELRWQAEESVRFGAVLEDSFGIRSQDPAAVSIVVVPDRVPAVSVLEPPQDEAVLATAVIDVVGEAKDDVALSHLTMEARVLAARADSPGAPPEPRGQPVEIAKWTPDAQGADARTARASATIELESFDVKPGDEIHLYAVARDNFALDGKTREPVLSAPRKLRIIGESQLIEQVLAELGTIRSAAQRIDLDEARLQKELPGLVQEGGSERAARMKKDQQSLTERMTPPASLVQRLTERVDRNALTDRTVRQMLEESARLLDEAARRSREASDALERGQQKDPDAPALAEEAEAARTAQSAVRDAMARLSSVLDQGKDGWATRREIEKLLEDQSKLSEQTRDAARQTGGKRLQDLTPEQRQELERLARAQQELSQRARAATDALQDRASKSRATDPAQSEAMEKAAEQSSRDQLEAMMQQASKNAGENQTASANDYQKKAEETLKKMMEELDKGTQKKNDSLRRMLAELVEQIEDLMARQNEEIAKLADATRLAPDETLDGSQIRLNQDTISVADSARKSGPETGAVADAVDAGANDQASAIKSLRLSPADSPAADRWERSALARLTEARDLARKLSERSEKSEQDKQREELRKAYDQSLQQQIAIRADTSGFVGKELSRRDRAAVRSLGEKQEELRVQLSELQTRTKELSEQGVFNFSHKRLDSLMDRAGSTLKDGVASAGVDGDQAASAALLRSLVDTLTEAKNDDDFRNAEGGGGGGGGQQGGPRPIIPPIAELKLLRALQQDAAGRTREASEKPSDASTIAEIGRFQRELAEQGETLIKKLAEQQGANKPAPEKPVEPAKPGEGPQ
ncbi:MAG: hypothetical protein JNM86_13900 [Phycisphaerae bacterium]|nr:hypothetical protein [Phycisphaerae bacterium]